MTRNFESLFLSVALLLTVGFVSACTEYDFGFADEMARVKKEKEFEKNFIDRYGDVDPNHNWGFDPMEVVCFDASSSSTRAEMNEGAGKVHVNRNQWTECDNNGYKDGALARNVAIPGWPNFDGYYYTVNGGGAYGSIVNTQPKNASEFQAAGDVTDYEVQYVSEWFRTHRYPTSENLHISDFFIQNISADNDREISADGKTATGKRINMFMDEPMNFGMDYLVFKTLDSHDDIDMTWTHMNNYNRTATNEMTDIEYWTEAEINYYKSLTEAEDYVSNAEIDAIASKNPGDPKSTAKGLDLDYKNYTNEVYVNENTHRRVIQYVTSSGTEDFAYRASFGVADTEEGSFFKNWVLVHLDWDEYGQDGQVHHRDGYYLAFDYESTKTVTNGDETTTEKVYQRDGFYSNWIVKITPAYDSGEPNTSRRRVLCEDLGNTYDFDFNDVVFDVYYETFYDIEQYANVVEAVITLQASGGTLPIFVGKSSTQSQYETHALFNSSSEQPVNVIVDKSSSARNRKEVAIYRVPLGAIKYDSPYTADQISISVIQKDAETGGTNVITLRPGNKQKTDSGEEVEVKDKKYAPQMIAVPVDTRWMQELIQIEDGYTIFDRWVNDASTYGENTNNSWLKTLLDEQNFF